MKLLSTAALLFAAPTLVLAQAAAPAKAAPADKPVATKAAAPAAKTATTSKKGVRRSALKAVEEVTPIDDDTNVKLTDSDLEIAKRVYLGNISCELGATVNITANEKRPGFFVVQINKSRFNMHPVESRTGATRLEDPRAGVMWLQLGNKSMLMNQKQGQRLADECMSPAQLTLADEMKKNPPVSLLEPLPSAKAAAAQAVAPAAAAPAQPAQAASATK